LAGDRFANYFRDFSRERAQARIREYKLVFLITGKGGKVRYAVRDSNPDAASIKRLPPERGSEDLPASSCSIPVLFPEILQARDASTGRQVACDASENLHFSDTGGNEHIPVSNPCPDCGLWWGRRRRGCSPSRGQDAAEEPDDA
jgi:hypothetical protein